MTSPIVPPHLQRRARIGVIFGREIQRAELAGDLVLAELLIELRDEVLVALDDVEGGAAHT